MAGIERQQGGHASLRGACGDQRVVRAPSADGVVRQSRQNGRMTCGVERRDLRLTDEVRLDERPGVGVRQAMGRRKPRELERRLPPDLGRNDQPGRITALVWTAAP